MKRIALLVVAALAGCNAEPGPAPRFADAGDHVNCIDLKQVSSRRVLPPSGVLFEMAGPVSYRNDLVGSCPSAARVGPSAIIETDSQSTQLCRDDRIRIYDPVEARATGARSFPQCRLGRFTPVASH